MKNFSQPAKIGLITLATLFATAIVTYCKLPYGFLSVVTAYVLLQLFHEQIYLKTLERILGPTFAFLLIAALLLLLQHYFYLFFFAATCLTFLYMYYYARDHHGYAMLLGGITVAFISAVAYTQNISDALQAGFYWVSNIVIGSLIVIVLATLYRKLFSAPIAAPSPSYHLLSPEYWQQWRLKSGFDSTALLIAGRITLTLLIILIINYFAHWNVIDVQALIAGTIVAAQFSKAHQRAFYRLLGVLSGAVVALGLAHVLTLLPAPAQQILLIICISLALTGCALGCEKFPRFTYIFLQAGVMLPIILIHQSGVAAVDLAWQRTLGSLEGGFVGVILVYLSQWVGRFLIKQDQ